MRLPLLKFGNLSRKKRVIIHNNNQGPCQCSICTQQTDEEETHRRDLIRSVKPAAHKSSTLTLVQFQNLIDPNMLAVKSARHEAKALYSVDSPIAETDIEIDD